ncbi:serine carboxypeptidase-like 34 [Rhodamnia argentea]|uniref:Serine carboxypeptidase-like 34 n=1 Tax=Rhodamnia argentea TaxID=178133 RepID=A0ABM3HUR0_9MYRT|nr:serine carboxypeptidase-like 34 [Rhodamnia argentea]
MALSAIVLCLCLCLLASATSSSSWKQIDPEVMAQQEADLITTLPGQTPASFCHYFGYISVNNGLGKALFYWFFEATSHAAEKPILLWLNGGPGCSSVGFGEARELGPFLVIDGLDSPTLSFNNYSWKKGTLTYDTAGYDPCLKNHATAYFNLPNVQQALHANVARIPRPWSLCSLEVRYSWKDMPFSVLPVLEKLIRGGIRLWVFSADTDGRVPVTSTRYTLKKLGLNITENWTPSYKGEEVGGWTIMYEGLTFVTVRGARHQVPTFAAKRSPQPTRRSPATPF